MVHHVARHRILQALTDPDEDTEDDDLDDGTAGRARSDLTHRSGNAPGGT